MPSQNPRNNKSETPTANTTTALAITPVSRELATRQSMFTAEQIELVKTQIAPPDTTNEELALFIDVCAERGLNPFAKHVYLIKRWDSNRNMNKMSIQVSIDGLRLIADRSGEYEGQVAPRWCGPDGIWRDVWVNPEPPVAALVAVYRKGFREPLAAVARWSTYAQTNKEGAPTKMWAQMPDLMLAKCAEALALRKAFPEQAGGLYTTEEMDRANTIETTGRIVEPAQIAATPTLQDVKSQIWQIVNGNWGWTNEQLQAVALHKSGKAIGTYDLDTMTSFYRYLVGLSEADRKSVLQDATGPTTFPPLTEDDGRDPAPTAADAEVIDVG